MQVANIEHTLPSLRAIHFYHDYDHAPQSCITAEEHWQYDEESTMNLFLLHNNLLYVDVERYAYVDIDRPSQPPATSIIRTVGSNTYERYYGRFTKAGAPIARHAALPAVGQLQLGQGKGREHWWED